MSIALSKVSEERSGGSRPAVSGILGAIRRAWYGVFVRQRWTIGFANGPLGTDGSWIGSGRLLDPLPGGDFLADPFFVPGTSARVVLCEWMQVRRGKGIIARVELTAERRIRDITPLIDLPNYHLSYPHVFTYEGRIYCSPESCHTRSVKLFELSTDAREVTARHDMLEGFAAVDPTIFEHEGRWWLMCTDAKDNRYNTHLFVFHAATPFGPWEPHARNPVVVDVRCARPAGAVFEKDGRLYRPAQDCSLRYGGGLRLMEIEQLTPEHYSERPVWGVYPPVGAHGRHGIHTLNGSDNVLVYDAYTERFAAFAWLDRLRERNR